MITFTSQINGFYSKNNTASPINHQNFTGLFGKNAKTGAKNSSNIARKIYSTMFLDKNDYISTIKDGYVYSKTYADEGNIIVSKKYKMWHRKPDAVIKENHITALAEKTVLNKDGSSNIEIRDVRTPEYKVSIGYKNVQKNNIHDDGIINIGYGDKQVEISKDKREDLRKEFDNILNEKFPESIKELKKLNEKDFDQYMSAYYLTPETTAYAILSSPKSLKSRLEIVPRAMPYGIECILDKLGK